MSNNVISNEHLLERLNWRYAVKKFDPAKKISDEDWTALEDALVLAPSSYGLQPWKFYVVTDAEVRKELRIHSWNQPQIEESSHVVVVAAKKDLSPEDVEKYLERISQVRGTKPEDLEGLKAMLLGTQKTATEAGFINEWAARQCFLSLGVLLSAAAMRGIDACPMEGFVPTEYDKVLGIGDDGYFSVVVCTLGYRNSAEDRLSTAAKVRYPKEEVIKRI